MTTDLKNNCLIDIFSICDKSELGILNQDNNITTYINSLDNPYSILSKIGRQNIKILFQNFNLKIKNLTCDNDSKEIAKEVFDNGKYEININNLEFALFNLLENNSSIVKESLLSKLIFSKDCTYGKYLIDNLELVVKTAIESYDSLIDTESTIDNILISNISVEIINKYIEKQQTKFHYSKEYKKNLLLHSYNHNKIIPIWDNITAGVNDGIFSCDEIKDYLENNAVEIANAKLISDEEQTILQIVNLDYTSKETLAILVKSFDFTINYGAVTKDLNRAILIECKKILYSEENFIASSISKFSFNAFINDEWNKCVDILDKIDYTEKFGESIDFVMENSKIATNIKEELLCSVSKYIPYSNLAIKECAKILINKDMSGLSSNILMQIMENSFIDNVDKKLLLIKYLELFSKQQIRTIVIALSSTYEGIIDGKMEKVKKDNPDIDEGILKILSTKNIIRLKREAWYFKFL